MIYDIVFPLLQFVNVTFSQKKMLGHATSSFTVYIYGHASSNIQSLAAEKFDSQFNSLK